eukprot:TRINITY_DN21052_c0_g1_i1.p1 TRINITY_DN21052_c0_g1~~TRINITY_DN21052_c0_g1_i1.p1  ORF type:complete len:625 (+),score=145.74 TRINITY_DN21052_c0_g1_i1:55-1875(+)
MPPKGSAKKKVSTTEEATKPSPEEKYAPGDSSKKIAIDEEFKDLSKDELLDLMKEKDKNLRNLQERIRKAKTESMEKKIREAELKKFNNAEREKIKTAFDLFDANGSGKIEIGELVALSKELGYDMNEKEAKEAMGNLDVDKNGCLCFDEFLLWWGSSSERGGNKGIKLDLMKVKIRGEMLQKDLKSHVERFARRTAPKAQTSQTFTLNATIGATKEESEGKTGIEFVMLPSDPIYFKSERQKLLPDHPITVIDEGEEVQMRFMIVVNFAMQEDVDPEDVPGLIDAINEAAERSNNHRSSLVPSIDDDGKLRVVILVRGVDDPVSEITSLFLHDDNPDYSGAKLFTILSVLLQTQQNGEEYLQWDCETPILEMLDRASLHAHAKLSSDVNDYLESFLFGTALREGELQSSSELRQMITLSVLGRLFRSVELEIHSNSSRDAVQQVVDGLATFPLKVAAKRGIINDDLNRECEELKQKFKLQLDSLFKTEMTVSALMANIVSRVLSLEEYTTVIKTIGHMCLAIDSVRVLHPMFTARANIWGFPFLKYLFEEDNEEVVNRVLEKRKAKKIFEGDDTFPATTQVLDKADDQFGKAFRAIISGDQNEFS